jgi:hypothetical protein
VPTSGASGQFGIGNLEFSSVDEVAAADAARRARERIELINLLSQPASGAQNLCCNNLYLEAGSGQPSACGCDGPGALEGLGDCAGHSADSQSHHLDGGVGLGGGLFDRSDYRGQESEFMHSPIMPAPPEGER